MEFRLLLTLTTFLTMSGAYLNAAANGAPGAWRGFKSLSSGRASSSSSSSSYAATVAPETSFGLPRPTTGKLTPIDGFDGLFNQLNKLYQLGCYDKTARIPDKNKRQEVLQKIAAVLPAHMTLHRATKIEYLKEQIKLSVDCYELASRQDSVVILRMLTDAEIDSFILEQLSLRDNRTIRCFIKQFAENQESAAAFKNTLVHPRSLLQRLSTLDKAEQKEQAYILIDFLNACGQDELVHYEDEIVPLMPLLLGRNQIYTLLQQKKSVALSQCALDNLIAYAKVENPSFFLFDELVASAKAQEDIGETDRIVWRLHEACATNISALQYMWLALLDASQLAMLKQSVTRYFNTPEIPLDERSAFSTFINTVINTAQASNTVMPHILIDALEAADETTFSRFIDPASRVKIHDSVIFEDQFAFVKRMNHLNARLQIPSDEREFLNSVHHRVQDTDFREYVDALLHMHNQQMASLSSVSYSSDYALCTAKKTVFKLLQKHAMPKRIPSYIIQRFGCLENFTVERLKESDPLYKINSLSNICIKPNELIYGTTYGRADSLLSAIDPETLDAVWQVPVGSSEGIAITMYDDVLYVIDSIASALLCFDKNTGQELQRHPLSVPCNIHRSIFLDSDTNGNLYFGYEGKDFENYIFFWDTKTKEGLLLIKGYCWQKFVCNNMFGYANNNDQTVRLFSKDTLIKTIPYVFGDTDRCFIPYISTHRDLLLFQRKMPDESCELVIYNTTSFNEELNIPLKNGSLRTEPCFSQDGKQLFFACGQKRGNSTIISLAFTDDGYQEMWETPINSEINQLMLSPDGKQLFLMYPPTGKLYALNAETGEQTLAISCNPYSALAGISSSGKPYVSQEL